MKQKLLKLDSRRRASFAKMGRPQDTWYLVEVLADGTMILTPAEVMG